MSVFTNDGGVRSSDCAPGAPRKTAYRVAPGTAVHVTRAMPGVPVTATFAGGCAAGDTGVRPTGGAIAGAAPAIAIGFSILDGAAGGAVAVARVVVTPSQPAG